MNQVRTGQDRGVLILELRDYHQANSLINNSLHFKGLILNCEFYNRAMRSKQCFKCWRYGHIRFSCKNQICGKCSQEGHYHEGCHEDITKCAMCGEPHRAYDRNCRHKLADRKRIKKEKLRTPIWHDGGRPTMRYRHQEESRQEGAETPDTEITDLRRASPVKGRVSTIGGSLLREIRKERAYCW